MLDSTTGLKPCIRCKVPKSPSEFYRKSTTRDGLSPYCRDCQREMIEPSRQANPNSKPKTRPYENLVIEKLISEGIYAVPGNTHKDMKWVDIVAWGCIRIETRASIPAKDGTYSWKIGTRGTQNPLQDNQFLVLVTIETYPRFYIFSPFHRVFYKQGNLKTGIAYKSNPMWRGRDRNIMTLELMEYHENKWHWINDMRDLMQKRKDFYILNTTYGV